ncbi:MAG TPA: ribosome biogenesis GTPase YlqF [Bacillota bacterium]|nr:ribosome biogenesis GTPase YlqF [Bacillota bacterium]
MEPIHWYPGHMAKAKRQLTEIVRYLDMIIEVRDARIPLASFNSDLEDLLRRRPRLVVLNKSDLAEPAVTTLWTQWFQKQAIPAVVVNGKNGQGVESVWRKLGETNQAPGNAKKIKRVGVVGIPNVGKSSILNRLLGTGAAKTGNLPGITRGKQWVKRNGIEVLDTPGLLPPKIDNPEDGVKLALTGAIRDEIMPMEDLALLLIDKYGALVLGQDESLPGLSAIEQLGRFAVKNGFLGKGGTPDLNRAATRLLKEFRDGHLGRFSLESPPTEPAGASL